MEDEILDVEIVLGNGQKQNLKIKKVDPFDWESIEKGKKALLCLLDNTQMLVEIVSADYDGVSFIVEGDKTTYFYEENVISAIYIEI